MLWTPDPVIEEAKQHPAWWPFFRVCGKAGLKFDQPARDNRKAGATWRVLAYTIKKNDLGGWNTFEAARGVGPTLFKCLEDALRKSGFTIPEAEPLLHRLLHGEPPPAPVDPLEGMFG